MKVVDGSERAEVRSQVVKASDSFFLYSTSKVLTYVQEIYGDGKTKKNTISTILYCTKRGAHLQKTES